MNKYLLLFVIAFSIISCQKKEKAQVKEEIERPNASIKKNHRLQERIKFEFKDEVEDWQMYWNLSDFIGRFNKVSANEVLSNALELEELVKQVKDSMKPGNLSSPALNARINILYNESLRLSDMTDIPAITSEQVHEQTDKVIKAFSSLNAKINTVLRKRKFEESIDLDGDFIGLDSTKIDKISIKALEEGKE